MADQSNERGEAVDEAEGRVAPIVYVRSVDVDSLPDAVRAQTGGAKQLYAIHNADGQCLALAPDRQQAFVMARMNALAPVSVH